MYDALNEAILIQEIILIQSADSFSFINDPDPYTNTVLRLQELGASYLTENPFSTSAQQTNFTLSP